MRCVPRPCCCGSCPWCCFRPMQGETHGENADLWTRAKAVEFYKMYLLFVLESDRWIVGQRDFLFRTSGKWMSLNQHLTHQSKNENGVYFYICGVFCHSWAVHVRNSCEKVATVYCSIQYENPGVNWWGVAGVIVFYLLILCIGLFASWKNKSYKKADSETVMLAERSIGLWMGMFTMTGLSMFSICSFWEHQRDVCFETAPVTQNKRKKRKSAKGKAGECFKSRRVTCYTVFNCCKKFWSGSVLIVGSTLEAIKEKLNLHLTGRTLFSGKFFFLAQQQIQLQVVRI